MRLADGRRRADALTCAAIGAALFLLSAWPILLVDVPPYQDLPGHMATASVIANKALYPELVFNGFLKTNSALVAWLVFAGSVVGIKLAAKSFVLLTMAATAFALPRFVLEVRGRPAMIVASAFMAPMVQSFWLSMGMVSFALGVAMALELLVRVERQIRAPSRARAIGLTALTFVLWYTHSIPLLVACFLALAYAAQRPSWQERVTAARAILLPLAPAALLVAYVMIAHVKGTRSAAAGTVESVELEAAAWTLYDLFGKWFYGFTELSATSIVCAVALFGVALPRARQGGDLFSPAATLVLIIGLFFLPYVMPGFGYVNVRLVPFVWMAALVRVPDALPRKALGAIAACAVLSVVGDDIDLLRLDREMRDFAAGIDAVPERARLLSLNFARRITSKNTWSLHTASGLYVIAKHTSAQDLWADSPTMPLMHASAPDWLGDWVQIRRFTDAHASTDGFCARTRDAGFRDEGCNARYASEWRMLWSEAASRFDHVLLWHPSADVLATVPSAYHVTFERNGLFILERTPLTE